VKDGGDCQDRGYYYGNAHCWHTPCQHLERIRSYRSQQDYLRKFSDYSRYSKEIVIGATNAKLLI